MDTFSRPYNSLSKPDLAGIKFSSTYLYRIWLHIKNPPIDIQDAWDKSSAFLIVPEWDVNLLQQRLRNCRSVQVLLTLNSVTTALWFLWLLCRAIKGKGRFYAQWGGQWYSGASVTALGLIRSGSFRLGCYLKTETLSCILPNPVSRGTLSPWRQDGRKLGQRGTIVK